MSRTSDAGTLSCRLLMTSSAAWLIIVTCCCCCCSCNSTDAQAQSVSVDNEEDSSRTGYACEGSELEIRCADDRRIHVINANYGRQAVNMCNDHGHPSTWNLSCIARRSLEIVRNRCKDGVNANCTISADNRAFGDPCVRTPKYLEVDYQCLRRGAVPASTLAITPPSSRTETAIIGTPSPSDNTETVVPDNIVAGLSSTPKTSDNESTPRSYCEQTTVRDVNWRQTAAGDTAHEPCPNSDQNDVLTAGWRCSKENGRWIGQPDLSRCVSNLIASLQDKLNAAKGELSVSIVNSVLDAVVSASKRRDLYGGDLRTLLSLLSDTVDQSAIRLLPSVDSSTAVILATNISSAVLSVGSSLLSDDQIPLWTDLGDSLRADTAGQLAVAVENSAFMRASVENQPRSIVVSDEQNIILEIDVVSSAAATDDIIFPKVDHADEQWKKNFGSVRMPSENLRQTSPDGLTRVVFASYNNLDRWLKVTQHQGQGDEERAAATLSEDIWNVNTKIISVSINGRKQLGAEERLNTPFEFTLEHSNDENSSFFHKCAYWKFATNNTPGNWSTDGCYVISSNSNRTQCSCDHLTNFAILMSITGDQATSGHEFALSLITYFGCIVSLICLILAFLTFLLFKNLQCDRNTIHKNLVLCLFIAESIFLLGIVQYEHKVLCSVVAGLLHYFFLAAFGWMFMEGIQLYAMLVEVFEAERSRIKWYYCGGYVVPAVIVLISASIYSGGYGTDNHCWLSANRGFIWAFVGPVVVILGVNLVMLSVAIFTMCRHAKTTANWQMKQKTQLQNIGSWLKASIVLVVLLGLTWIFGIFYIDIQTVFMAYIFTLFNSLQGLFIFVFHCLMSEKVQKEYRKWIQRTTWLPQALRNYGDGTASRGGTTVPNQSASTVGGAHYLAKLWGSRKGKSPSNCSDLKMRHVNHTDAAEKVLIVVSSPRDNRRGKAALMTASHDSESARLTDTSSGRCTSGYSSSSASGNDSSVRLLQPGSGYAGWDSSTSNADGNTEDPRDYMDQTLTRLDEAEYDHGDGGPWSGPDADAVSIDDDDHKTPLHQHPADRSNGLQ